MKKQYLNPIIDIYTITTEHLFQRTLLQLPKPLTTQKLGQRNIISTSGRKKTYTTIYSFHIDTDYDDF